MQELFAWWNMTVSITDRIGWDEDQKTDHDGQQKRFIYLDARCTLALGRIPTPAIQNEKLKWVATADLASYQLNPPSQTVLTKLGYKV